MDDVARLRYTRMTTIQIRLDKIELYSSHSWEIFLSQQQKEDNKIAGDQKGESYEYIAQLYSTENSVTDNMLHQQWLLKTLMADGMNYQITMSLYNFSS